MRARPRRTAAFVARMLCRVRTSRPSHAALRGPVYIALVVLAAFGAATLPHCTVERTRGLGDPCLQDRECVDGLRCLATPDNHTACAPQPSGLPDVVVVREASTVDAQPVDAALDAAPDARPLDDAQRGDGAADAPEAANAADAGFDR